VLLALMVARLYEPTAFVKSYERKLPEALCATDTPVGFAGKDTVASSTLPGVGEGLDRNTHLAVERVNTERAPLPQMFRKTTVTVVCRPRLECAE
jgi:hypothetical protein